MLEGKARVEDTDMPARMQAAATSAASRALDLFDVADCRAIAGHIKAASCSTPISSISMDLEFDKRYGVGWQCVVGANFGCFFTHTSGTFIYFSLERLSFLLFKAAAAAAIDAS
uniref:Dynein light chain n=1 Tax=Oryza meridionalis TaxID=40149 RepID=A0A0E0CIU0_9ORYZ